MCDFSLHQANAIGLPRCDPVKGHLRPQLKWGVGSGFQSSDVQLQSPSSDVRFQFDAEVMGLQQALRNRCFTYKTVKARYKTVKARYKTVKARFWPWLHVKVLQTPLRACASNPRMCKFSRHLRVCASSLTRRCWGSSSSSATGAGRVMA